MIAGKRRLLIALVSGAVLALTGCESSTTEGEATATTPSMAANVPTGFDPCTDTPQSVLDSEGLRMKTDDDFGAGGVEWEGCQWAKVDGYAASIQTTNLTIQMVRDKGFPGTVEFTVDGRSAITSQRQETDTDAACSVNVELTGGSLEFSLSNPPSRSETGHLDTCELARSLAEKVVPSIPAGA